MPIRFDRKPGLVVYLTAGDPSLDATRAIALAAIDAGADVIELGVPFSDPLADGPIIQRASERALARGTRLSDVLQLARAIRAERLAPGLVIFSYLNPILRYGLTRFANDAAASGVGRDTDRKDGGEPACKPSSVPRLASRRRSSISGRRLPDGSSGRPEDWAARPLPFDRTVARALEPRPPIWPCSG